MGGFGFWCLGWALGSGFWCLEMALGTGFWCQTLSLVDEPWVKQDCANLSDTERGVWVGQYYAYD